MPNTTRRQGTRSDSHADPANQVTRAQQGNPLCKEQGYGPHAHHTTEAPPDQGPRSDLGLSPKFHF